MANTHGRSVGIRDVASAAGVSPQTVSRVLNEHHSVRPETREKVQAAVERLGYRRNYAARSLSTGQNKIIGLVTIKTDSYARSVVVDSIEDAAAELDHAVVKGPISSMEPGVVEAAVQELVDRGADGIILAVPIIDASALLDSIALQIPIVTLDGSRTESSEALVIDQALVAQLATDHLLSLGHESVWHVAGPQDWIEALNRSHGWRKALERGRRVPEDVSVVGVDNISLAAYSSPALTTVVQPFAVIGRLAVQRLLHRVQDSEAPVRPFALAPELIVRSSTAAPAAH